MPRSKAALWAAFWMFLSPSAELSYLPVFIFIPPFSFFLCVHANGVTPSSPLRLTVVKARFL